MSPQLESAEIRDTDTEDERENGQQNERENGQQNEEEEEEEEEEEDEDEEEEDGPNPFKAEAEAKARVVQLRAKALAFWHKGELTIYSLIMLKRGRGLFWSSQGLLVLLYVSRLFTFFEYLSKSLNVNNTHLNLCP